jgi:hypothetical protein
MTMVPMFEYNELDELPWPRPQLRVIDGGQVRRPAAAHVARRRPSARVLRRRRQVVGAAALLLVVSTFAGLWSLLPSELPAGAASSMVPGVALAGTYTVQQGDTFNSVVAQVANGRPTAQVAAAVEAEIGSTIVVPGEQIPIP